MADSQYQTGMNLGEPDVFESSDLPEVDQPAVNTELNSLSVEKLDINVSDAYKHFSRKSINSTDLASRQTGYYVPHNGDYELLGAEDHVKETVEQKFQRLQREVLELAEDVDHIKESAKTDSSVANPVTLAKHVEFLNKQLQDLSLDKQLGERDGGISLSDPHGTLHKRLMTELDAYKATDLKSKSGASGKAKGDNDTSLAEGDHMTFKLFYQPQQAHFNTTTRFAELEQRLGRIESLLGHDVGKLSMLTSDVANGDVLGAMSLLTAQAKLLDLNNLDIVENRLTTVGHRLDQLNERTQKLEQSGKISKVAELEEQIAKWDPLSTSLPAIVERLTALKDLHEQALQCKQTMTHLEAAQKQIADHLKAHSAELKQVQCTFETNLATIQSNSNSLAERLKKLNK